VHGPSLRLKVFNRALETLSFALWVGMFCLAGQAAGRHVGWPAAGTAAGAALGIGPAVMWGVLKSRPQNLYNVLVPAVYLLAYNALDRPGPGPPSGLLLYVSAAVLAVGAVMAAGGAWGWVEERRLRDPSRMSASRLLKALSGLESYQDEDRRRIMEELESRPDETFDCLQPYFTRKYPHESYFELIRRIGGPRADRLLREVMEKSSHHYTLLYAIRTAGELGHESFTPRLKELAAGDDEVLAAAALLALQKIGAPDALAFIEERQADSPSQ
jgi:hypothetical protein